MRAQIVTFSMLARNGELRARGGKLIQMSHSCHLVETTLLPNSSYVTTKLCGTSTCGCNNNTIFSDRAILTFLTVDVCREQYQGALFEKFWLATIPNQIQNWSAISDIAILCQLVYFMSHALKTAAVVPTDSVKHEARFNGTSPVPSEEKTRNILQLIKQLMKNKINNFFLKKQLGFSFLPSWFRQKRCDFVD